MRNVMREIDVPDWQERLAAYLPQEDSERRDLQEVLQAVRQDGSRVLYRERQNGHITCSGFVMDPTLSEVLMVYHNIYDSFAWTGGHADGVNDFLAVAVREAKEETGIRKPYAQSGEILSVDVLPVKAHRKHGVSVPAHVHYNITYGLIASKKEKLRVKPDENQAVRWIPMAQLRELCREPQMIPIYEKLAEQYQGQFPRTWKEVRALPGVGDYTAGAICSICFDLPTPAVDGNVLRVTARVTDTFCEIDRPEQKAAVTQVLTEVYQAGHCGTLTQALMEIGATVCLPNGKPLCDVCPLASLCMARRNGDVLRLPQRIEKKARRKESYTVFLLCCDGKYAVRKRQEKGLLSGLWEYPNAAGILETDAAVAQAAAWGCQPVEVVRTTERSHIFTHVEWKMKGVLITCQTPAEGFVWRTAEEIAQELSLPTAFRQFSAFLSES